MQAKSQRKMRPLPLQTRVKGLVGSQSMITEREKMFKRAQVALKKLDAFEKASRKKKLVAGGPNCSCRRKIDEDAKDGALETMAELVSKFNPYEHARKNR